GVGAASEFVALGGPSPGGSRGAPRWVVDARATRIIASERAFELPMVSGRSGGGRVDGLNGGTWQRASGKYMVPVAQPGGTNHESSIAFVLDPALIRRAITDNLGELDKLFSGAARRNLYDPSDQAIRPMDLCPARPSDTDWKEKFESQRVLGAR